MRRLVAPVLVGAVVALAVSPARAQDPAGVVPLPPGGVDNESCLRCHSDKKLVPLTDRGKKLNLYVFDEEFAGTFHENLACVDCHQGAQTFDKAPHNGGEPLALTCQPCHAAVIEEFDASVHGKLRAKDDPDAPTCSDCHGRHNIYPRTDLRSNVNKFRVAETCASCHLVTGIPATRTVGQPTAVSQYEDSIHGRALKIDGLTVAPTCNDCHGSHDIQPHEDAASHIAKSHIPDTCGHCHVKVEETYLKSVHGELLAKGDDRGPTCIQCHSSHEIDIPTRPEFRTALDGKCGGCHKEKVAEYRETLHGKAIVLGRTNVAACSDCHGHHDILPSSNPASTIHPQNRLQTCRQCHKNATRNFADYVVHAHHTDKKASPQVYYVYIFMTALLIGTFAFFALHTILWAIRSVVAFARNRKHFSELKKMSKADKEQYVRFRPIDRFLHLLVILSFIMLVATGMPLKFYYTDWAKQMLAAMNGQEVAAFLHRVGAVITGFYFFVHIGTTLYSVWKGRVRFRNQQTGRYSLKVFVSELFGPDSPMPRWQDVKDFIAHQKWFLGRGEQPQFDRWTYWEKFDYLAVFWGVAVIGTSGLIMWFPELFTQFLPGWMINVSLVVHSDEALLAAGFIFTFHFFNVHFRLEKFPIDTVIFSGRISRTELHHERRRQLERWQKAGKLAENRVKDEWAAWRKIAVPAGVLAFLIGVTIVALIYSAIITRFLND